MTMQIWARLSEKGFYLIVEDSATTPPKGDSGAAPSQDFAVRLAPAAAAEFLKKLAIEALRGAMPGTTVVLGDNFADASPRARREHVQQALLADATSAPRGAEVSDAEEVQLTNCRSCGAQIFFLRLSGKAHPVDAAPATDGNLVIVDGRLSAWDERTDAGRTRYKSHFATCPHARQWRKKQRR